MRRADIDELRGDIRELTTAQRRTEQLVQDLAVAQQRTEQRVEELTAAQVRGEQRMNSMQEAIEKLTAAQLRTESELHSLIGTVEKLADDQKETRRQLGGLTMTVGNQLEDLAYRALPPLLQRDFNQVVEGGLKRGYVNDNRGKPQEVNILGTARRNGTQMTIIGESKAQLCKNDVDRFLRRTVQQLTDLYDTMFPVLVTCMISEPDVETYAREQNVAIYYSYDF